MDLTTAGATLPDVLVCVVPGRILRTEVVDVPHPLYAFLLTSSLQSLKSGHRIHPLDVSLK